MLAYNNSGLKNKCLHCNYTVQENALSCDETLLLYNTVERIVNTFIQLCQVVIITVNVILTDHFEMISQLQNNPCDTCLQLEIQIRFTPDQ